jgi:ABC-2 type transport system ATP-binding protein
VTEATGATDARGGVRVEIRDLTKRYGGASGVLALDGLDLDVPAGSVFGLLGPNGAGKTTTLRLLVGLAHPTRGSVVIDEGRIDPARPDRRLGIGVLDQDPRYYGWMRGRELVEMVARLHGCSVSEARSRALEVLERVGLADAANRTIRAHSGGMRQRLGIAQALVDRPRLLVLDEPVSSLDPEGRRDVLALIAELRETATVIFSTHVLTDIERICDRVAILDRGRLVTEAPLDDLLARYALPLYRLVPETGEDAGLARLATALRSVPWVDRVDVDGVTMTVGVTDELVASRELLRAVVAAEVRLASFERVRPDLEDVFLRLVGRGSAETAA